MEEGVRSWAAAAHAGVAAVRHYGGASPGDRTMLDALHPAAEALMHAAGIHLSTYLYLSS